MASRPEEDPDDLEGLVAQSPQAALAAAAGESDDTIDLAALAKLSTPAARSSEPPRSSAPPRAHDYDHDRDRDQHYDAFAGHDLRALPPARVPAPARGSHALALLTLALGFALGVPAGAWWFGGARVQGGESTAAAAPTPGAPASATSGVAAPAPVAAVVPAAAPAAAQRPVAAAPTQPVQAPRPAAAERVLASATPAYKAPAAERALGEPPLAPPTAPRALARPSASSASAAEPVAEPAPTAEPPAPAIVLEDSQPAAPKPATAAATRSVDTMLDDALANPSERNAGQRPQLDGDALPQSPSRDDVSQAMTVLLPAIRGCAMGQTGLATAAIVVHNDGRVASISVAGAPFAGTASGRCMEGVMRRARFPRFKQSLFRVQFPFAIQ